MYSTLLIELHFFRKFNLRDRTIYTCTHTDNMYSYNACLQGSAKNTAAKCTTVHVL